MKGEGAAREMLGSLMKSLFVPPFSIYLIVVPYGHRPKLGGLLEYKNIILNSSCWNFDIVALTLKWYFRPTELGKSPSFNT